MEKNFLVAGPGFEPRSSLSESDETTIALPRIVLIFYHLVVQISALFGYFVLSTLFGDLHFVSTCEVTKQQKKFRDFGKLSQ